MAFQTFVTKICKKDKVKRSKNNAVQDRLRSTGDFQHQCSKLSNKLWTKKSEDEILTQVTRS